MEVREAKETVPSERPIRIAIEIQEAEREAPSAGQTKASAPPPMLLGVHGIGPEFASVLWSRDSPDTPIIADRSPLYAGLAPTPWRSWSGCAAGASADRWGAEAFLPPPRGLCPAEAAPRRWRSLRV